MKHKKLFISITAFGTVAVFLAIFLMIWFFGDKYEDFDQYFRQEIAIEGLDDGAIPQGINTYSVEYSFTDEEGRNQRQTKRYFFVSAYMNDGSASRIYVTDEKDGFVGYVTLKNTDGTDFCGHCGGIATNGNTLWVTGESKIHVAKASEEYSEARKNITREIVERAAMENPEDKAVTFTSEFAANCNASFLFYYDDPRTTAVYNDKLYVGEFYRKGNYETDLKHRITTPAGYKNTAFMYEYDVDSNSNNKYGLDLISSEEGLAEDDRVPKIQKIFSLPEKIQGVAFSGKTSYSANDGILVLSQSYGLSNSRLLCFNYSLMNTSRKRYTESDIGGETKESFVYEGVYKKIGSTDIEYSDSSLYVYYADCNDEEMFVNDYSIPSMSEGMCILPTTDAPSTRIYVLFESASKKYKMFVRRQLTNVYSFIPRNR